MDHALARVANYPGCRCLSQVAPPEDIVFPASTGYEPLKGLAPHSIREPLSRANVALGSTARSDTSASTWSLIQWFRRYGGLLYTAFCRQCGQKYLLSVKHWGRGTEVGSDCPENALM